MYEALSRASVVIEVIEDVEQYEATLVSTNGVILQPYDTSTTLVGSVLKNKIDVTNKIKDLRWSKWNPTKDNLIECSDWGKDYKGVNIIEIEKDDVDSKSIFVFEAYNDSGDLLCSTSISIVDINDLLVSTNKPASPYVGQLWVDDSKEPATLYVWNGYKWIVSGSVGTIVKNLLKNTSFVYNVDNWDIVGDKKKSYAPYAIDYIGHRFLVLKSETLTDEARGISQTTADIINVNSEYSFQMIFYSKEDTETFSNNIYINIYSVDKNSEEVLIHSETVSAERNMQRIFTTFKTREDTVQIKVEILGESNYRYNFSVGELAIYNTWNDYPWTINPADLVVRDSTYTQEELWNILSNNGTVQGIFSEINPVTGQLDYYINASMIAAGRVKAEFMEMYGLKVLRKDTKEVSLHISDNGEITINSPKIILSSGQTIEEAISNASVEIDPNMIKTTVIELVTSDDEIKSSIGSVAEQTAKGFVNTVKDELNGRISVTEQTVNGFSQRIEDAEGNASTAIQTVNSFDRRIQDAEGNASSAKQTADGISARVENVETGQESLVELTSKGVYVGSGNAFVDINGNKITVSASDVHIDAENIALEGYTTINGGFGVDLEGNMHAKNGTFEGTISASAIDMSTIKSSALIAPNIKSDETDNPAFSLTEDGTLTALNAVIKGEMSGTILSGNYFKSANDKFVVLPNGTLECEDANIKGNIKAGSTITSSVVTGGKIIGTVIQNAEENPTFSVATDGTITGASIKGGSIGIGGGNYDAFVVDNNGNCKITKGSISIGENFIVGIDGVLTATGANFTGSINTGSSITGTDINGGTITGTTIKNASNTFSINADGNISGGSITIKDNFKVTNDGKLTAKSADITGSITATGGKIGGYTIGEYKLTASNVGMCSNDSVEWAFWAGSNTGDNAPFHVGHDGHLYATNVTITGGSIHSGTSVDGGCLTIGSVNADKLAANSITADKVAAGAITADKLAVTDLSALIATIGGFTISDGKLVGTASSGYVGLSGDGTDWAFWAGADTGGNAPFHVGHNGWVYASNATITGDITATSGSFTGTITAEQGEIGGFTIGQTTLKGTNVGLCSSTGEWAFWAGASTGGAAAFHVGHDGKLYSSSANISGNISGSTITASSFSDPNDFFVVDSDGTVTAQSINIKSEVSAKTVVGEYLAIPWYSKSLTKDMTCYIRTGYSYPIKDVNRILEDGIYASFDDLQDYVPRNLNGYTLTVNFESDVTEQLNIDNFNNGIIRIAFNGHTLKGNIRAIGRSIEIIIYGNKPGSTKGSTRGKIVPGKNGYLYNKYTYCIVGDKCRITVYDIDLYSGTTATSSNMTGNNGICCTNGAVGYLSAIKAINEPYALVRIHSVSHVYVESSSGRSKDRTFQAISGSIMHLNDTTQAGTTGSKGTIYTKDNAKIFADGVKYDTNTPVVDPTPVEPPKSNTITVTKTVNSTAGRSWRTSGNYANSWSTESIVRQGQWTTGNGKNKGYWFFGNDIYNILQNNNNTVTSMTVKITRNSGGVNAAVTHYLRAHTISSKPSGTPTDYLGTSTLNKSFSLAVGNSITLTLSSTEISNLKSSKAKGFGLYTSDFTTGKNGPYSCCSSSCTVTIKYKTTES